MSYISKRLGAAARSDQIHCRDLLAGLLGIGLLVSSQSLVPSTGPGVQDSPFTVLSREVAGWIQERWVKEECIVFHAELEQHVHLMAIVIQVDKFPPKFWSFFTKIFEFG